MEKLVRFKVFPKIVSGTGEIIYCIQEEDTSDFFFKSFKTKSEGLDIVFSLIDYYGDRMPKRHNLELLSKVLQADLPLINNFYQPYHEQKSLPAALPKPVSLFKIIQSRETKTFAIIKEGEPKEVIGIFDNKNDGLNIVHGLAKFETPPYHIIGLCTQVLQLNIPFLAKPQRVYTERKRDFH